MRHEGISAGTATCNDQNIWDEACRISTRERACGALANGGMVSTASDYMRFCKMLANGGTLDGQRVIGPRTLAYMARNHLPEGRDLAQMSPASAGETSRAGVGFGLGFACVLDATVLGGLSVPGEYYWGGAASTAFWITPVEDLAVVFMTQVRPSSTYPIRRELRALIYSAIVD